MHTTDTEATVAGSADRGASKIEQLSDSAHHTVDRITEAAASTLRSAGMRGQHWMHQQDELLEGARECVRRHPVASVMIALGVGMLFSRFTRH